MESLSALVELVQNERPGRSKGGDRAAAQTSAQSATDHRKLLNGVMVGLINQSENWKLQWAAIAALSRSGEVEHLAPLEQLRKQVGWGEPLDFVLSQAIDQLKRRLHTALALTSPS